MSEESFLAEYSSESAVLRYTKKTAGSGINYLLEREYGGIYLDAIRNQMSAPTGDGIRLLEFGCGAGMNLLHCVNMLERERIPLAAAYGTDFSQPLITEGCREAMCLPAHLRNRVNFLVGRHERLSADLAAGLNLPASKLLGSFHLIVGVNTFRYCYRLGKGLDCAREIYDLLKPGGVCVMIDMNHNFPMFRTRLRDRMTRPKDEWYLPTLDEYAQPFAATGFQLLERKHFCWVPHSAGPVLLATCRMLTPLLNTFARSFAMRSLVISKKPA